MAFCIEFIEDAVPAYYLKPNEKTVFGKITIGEFSERFLASTEYWSQEQYRKQWVEAVDRLINGPCSNTEALIANMYDPSMANFICCWPLFREGDKVYIHNNLLFMDKIKPPFELDRVGSYIGERETVNEDGDKISEWVTTIGELKGWLQESKGK